MITVSSGANVGGSTLRLKEIIPGPGRHIPEYLNLQEATAGCIVP